MNKIQLDLTLSWRCKIHENVFDKMDEWEFDYITVCSWYTWNVNIIYWDSEKIGHLRSSMKPTSICSCSNIPALPTNIIIGLEFGDRFCSHWFTTKNVIRGRQCIYPANSAYFLFHVLAHREKHRFQQQWLVDRSWTSTNLYVFFVCRSRIDHFPSDQSLCLRFKFIRNMLLKP